MKNHIKNYIKIMGLAAVPFGTAQAIDYEIKVTQEYKCDPNDPKSEKDGTMHFDISISKDGSWHTEHVEFLISDVVFRGRMGCTCDSGVRMVAWFDKEKGGARFALTVTGPIYNAYVTSDVPTVGVGCFDVYASDNEIFDRDIRHEAMWGWDIDLGAACFVYKKDPIRGEPCVIRGSGCFWDSVLARWDPMERKVIFNAGHIGDSCRDRSYRDKLRGQSQYVYVERELQKEVNNVKTFREAFRCAQTEVVREERRSAGNYLKVLYIFEKEQCKRLKAELEKIKDEKAGVSEIKEKK